MKSLLIGCLLTVLATPAQAQPQLAKNYAVQYVNKPYRPATTLAVLPAGQFVDAQGMPDHDDGIAGDYTPGFLMEYNGMQTWQINISINGWISLGHQSFPISSADNKLLFSTSAPYNVIAPYWGDHYYRTNEPGYRPSSITAVDSVYDDPNPNAPPGSQLGYFTLEWKDLNVNVKSDPSSIATFQLHLIENPMANDKNAPDHRVIIEFDYGTYGVKLGAAVGIEDSTGSSFINAMSPKDPTSTLLCNTWPPSGLPDGVIQFFPIGKERAGLPIDSCYGMNVVQMPYSQMASGNLVPDNSFIDSAGRSSHDDGIAQNTSTDVAPVIDPLSFNFLGKLYDSVNICINGWISLGASMNAQNSAVGTALFSHASPNNTIAPLWGDWYYRALETGFKPSKISYATVETPDPNLNAPPGSMLHIFIVEWKEMNIDKSNPDAIASFQLRIVENPMAHDNSAPDLRPSFQFCYGTLGTSNHVSVGIKDATGISHLNPVFASSFAGGDSTRLSTRQTQNWPPVGSPGQAIQFVPLTPQKGSVTPGSDLLLPHSSVAVSPNPAKTELLVSYTAAGPEAEIELYNLLGVRVNSSRVRSTGKTKLDVASLPAGTYELVVRDGESIHTQEVRIVR